VWRPKLGEEERFDRRPHRAWGATPKRHLLAGPTVSARHATIGAGDQAQ
jgi:hypothetical protein